MNALLEALANPSSMTGQQWMTLGIMLLILVGLIYFVWRFFKIAFNGQRKQPYVPNIGNRRSRLDPQGRPRPPLSDEEGKG